MKMLAIVSLVIGGMLLAVMLLTCVACTSARLHVECVAGLVERAVLVVESVCAPPEHAAVHWSGAYVLPSKYSTAPAHPSPVGLLMCTLAREA